MLRAFTPPFTASGRSSLVAPPPWHYAGWLLNVEFDCDPTHGAALVPPALGRPTGRGCLHFAHWQACGNGGAELLDPIYAQYRETIVVLELARDGGPPAGYCPFIWVDQDISLLRGWLQGWPKKMGSTWLTLSLPLEHPAAAPLRAGTRLGASLSVKDRRLVEARLTLTGAPGERLGFLARPTIGAVGWADLTQPQDCPQPQFVRADIADVVAPQWWAAEGQITSFAHPVEELELLGELRATRASAGWAGLTVRGALGLSSAR
ncbi:acetoacetate decarboxylase family protein [Aquincola sp. S2]|uniref:Acetoacetate decarboxylase family protein n=1 Tax=Pseudaquabacterium terrae TaxID=2732868 RepID=A0ABX2E901_9BURK|nr:acetoacetate decarboxylase family protein [Aquabacterium terrae]NRF65405.1 acetoacetate decarboxylase family protein [Aquabacterium terrae]